MPSMESTVSGIRSGVVVLVSSMVASLIGMFILSRYLPKVPVLRGIIPPNPMPSDVLMDDPYPGAARVGDIGVTMVGLRPAGKARFGGAMVDVVSRGEYIEVGTAVEVIDRRGNRIVVRVAPMSS